MSNTTYQLGSATITNDLIFGWTIRAGKEFYMLSQLDSGTLKEIVNANLPVWMNDFRTACAVQFPKTIAQEKTLQAMRDGAREREAAALLKQAEAARLREEVYLRRQAEIHAIKETILEGLRTTDTVNTQIDSDHVYAVLLKTLEEGKETYRVVDRKGREKYKGDSLLNAAAAIERVGW